MTNFNTNFWFEPGFDEKLKAFILENQFADATFSCLNESHRWAKLFLNSGLKVDIYLFEGMYEVDGEPNQAEGHTWLTVNGFIFDPTAGQFEEKIDSMHYVAHDYCDHDDLPARLALYGIKV